MSNRFDVLIRDTTIVDGTGTPGFKGSVAISGEKITAVGDIEGDAAKVIDGAGLVTCPGFVDPHSHADVSILQYPLAENLIMQGITTFVGGNCGLTLAPIKDPNYIKTSLKGFGFEAEPDWRTFHEWLSKVEAVGLSPNYVPLVGHNTVRVAVIGEDFKREATSGEIEEMKSYVDEAMGSGAVGLSSFFDPSPGEYAAMEEIVALAKVAAKHGGRYVPHTRHTQTQWPSDDPEEYGYGIFHGPMKDVWVGRYRGYLEAIEISKRAEIPLHIGHLANAYKIPQPHPEYLEEAAARATLEIMDSANAEGADVTFDTITCRSGIASQRPLISEFLQARNPALEWVKQFGKEEFAEQLKSAKVRERLRSVYQAGRLKLGMIHTKAHPYWMDCFTIIRCSNEAFEGKTISEIAASRNADPLDVIFDLLVEDPDTIWVQFASEKRPPGVLREFLRHPISMPCTDVFALPAKPQTDKSPPPIAYGLYPHYLETYVKKEAVLSLEEAIKKATFLPAQRFGLQDRGTLHPGAYADIVLFDLDTIKMKGDFVNPAQAPEGIEYVFVNGQMVHRDGTHTGARPGRVLRSV